MGDPLQRWLTWLDRSSSAEQIEEVTKMGLRKGRAEGIQTGLQKSRVDIVRKMKTMGLSAELIVQSTGLTSVEIEKL